MKPLTNVGSHLSKRAELDPGLEALVDHATGRRFTFSELDARADRTAHVLAGLGLKKGDRVAVLLPNGHPLWKPFTARPGPGSWSSC
jgi:acyl-CoA synthetase (AMP-forming)/AMP-acid ligase II